MIFLLVLKGKIVDSAKTPGQLDFQKVSARPSFEVCVRIDDTIYPIAAMNLAGYGHCSDWVVKQLCEEIDLRRAMPGFEDEIKLMDGPIIAFGEVNIDPDGRLM